MRCLLPAGLLGLALCAAPKASALELELCVDDRAGLPTPALAAFEHELRLAMEEPRLKVRRSLCSPESVMLTLLPKRDGLPTDVLGLAYRKGERIEPRVEVFLDPLRELTRARCWSTVGIAAARVAVHELAHYLEQTADHRSSGIRRAALTARQLTESGLPLRLR